MTQTTMQLTYTPTVIPRRTNLFVVTFFHEHGDADETTTAKVEVSLSKDDFPKYLAKVHEIAAQIQDSRSIGESLPKDFEELAVFNGMYISVERDCFTKMNISNYYAEMRVASIFYFDDNGAQFDVKGY